MASARALGSGVDSPPAASASAVSAPKGFLPGSGELLAQRPPRAGPVGASALAWVKGWALLLARGPALGMAAAPVRAAPGLAAALSAYFLLVCVAPPFFASPHTMSGLFQILVALVRLVVCFLA